ncbi:hypothetical protein D9M69_657710 [compost metagenome]
MTAKIVTARTNATTSIVNKIGKISERTSIFDDANSRPAKRKTNEFAINAMCSVTLPRYSSVFGLSVCLE